MSEALVLSGQNETLAGSHDNDVQPEPSQIDWKGIWKPLSLIVGGFLLFFFLPMDSARFTHSVIESLALAKWYAQEHVLLCLVPAFFIAGAVAVFVSQGAVMKYLGAVFMHSAASVCRHLEAGRRPGTGHCLSLLGTGHQRPGHHPHRPYTGA